MADLEKVNVREFRNNMSKYMGKTTPFAVTRHGQTVGYYIPARSTPSEAERLSLQKASEALDAMLTQQGITEDELVQEFRDLREI
jgi:antitoxin (DNA-binding transcriptional repressor) of toxin-antitoxin stability system